jgi:hypothetical protein
VVCEFEVDVWKGGGGVPDDEERRGLWNLRMGLSWGVEGRVESKSRT